MGQTPIFKPLPAWVVAEGEIFSVLLGFFFAPIFSVVSAAGPLFAWLSPHKRQQACRKPLLLLQLLLLLLQLLLLPQFQPRQPPSLY